MKTAVIVPPAYINWAYARRTSYHMALGQWLVKYPTYLYHFTEMHRRGDFIMVDNGAAEPEDERVPFTDVVAFADKVRADEIVLLDVIKDSEATITSTVQSARGIHPMRRCVVPQGKTWDEWVYCLGEIELQLGGKFATIGVAKHLEALEGGRVKALKLLRGHRKVYNIHMFGLYKYPEAEIANALEEYGQIRGIDSGAPIAYAQYSRWIGEDVHYSLEENTEPDRRFTDLNIDTMVGWCNE